MHLSGYRFSLLLALFASAAITAKAATFVWTEQESDTIEIGYGLALTDVDGDGKRDILVAEKKHPMVSKPLLAKTHHRQRPDRAGQCLHRSQGH